VAIAKTGYGTKNKRQSEKKKQVHKNKRRGKGEGGGLKELTGEEKLERGQMFSL
jgi:hypothetical protein